MAVFSHPPHLSPVDECDVPLEQYAQEEQALHEFRINSELYSGIIRQKTNWLFKNGFSYGRLAFGPSHLTVVDRAHLHYGSQMWNECQDSTISALSSTEWRELHSKLSFKPSNQ